MDSLRSLALVLFGVALGWTAGGLYWIPYHRAKVDDYEDRLRNEKRLEQETSLALFRSVERNNHLAVEVDRLRREFMKSRDILALPAAEPVERIPAPVPAVPTRPDGKPDEKPDGGN